MSNYVTKTVKEFCNNCESARHFDAVYQNGVLIELVCHECEVVDSFPYDDED